jgi:hypothetical protein
VHDDILSARQRTVHFFQGFTQLRFRSRNLTIGNWKGRKFQPQLSGFEGFFPKVEIPFLFRGKQRENRVDPRALPIRDIIFEPVSSSWARGDMVTLLAPSQ